MKPKKESREPAVKRIAIQYRRAKMRLENDTYLGVIKENDRRTRDDSEFIYLIDKALSECSEDTQRIITHEYLKERKSKWYLEANYSKSTFYRLKALAINEFLNCLGV